jgi:NAD+ synthase
MVMGSSNRTERLTGYFTKYGDGGVDLMPLGDLYKNQIRQLASYLDIPTSIQEKKPSAGLWPGQTDEGELGIYYNTLDLILYGLDSGMTSEEISSETGVEPSLVDRFLRRVEANEHKRRLPNVLRLRTASG